MSQTLSITSDCEPTGKTMAGPPGDDLAAGVARIEGALHAILVPGQITELRALSACIDGGDRPGHAARLL